MPNSNLEQFFGGEKGNSGSHKEVEGHSTIISTSLNSTTPVHPLGFTPIKIENVRVDIYQLNYGGYFSKHGTSMFNIKPRKDATFYFSPNLDFGNSLGPWSALRIYTSIDANNNLILKTPYSSPSLVCVFRIYEIEE